MKKFTPRLERLIFEARYSYGNLYFDRCGITLNDIERECEGWIAGEATPQTGNLNRPDKNSHVGFNNEKFDFAVEKASSVWRNSLELDCAYNIICPRYQSMKLNNLLVILLLI